MIRRTAPKGLRCRESGGGHGVPLHFGVTDGRCKLIRFPEPGLDTRELFDRHTDPLELESRHGDPGLAMIQERFDAGLLRLQEK